MDIVEAAHIKSIQCKVGETIGIVAISRPVRPPFLLVKPFIELPPFLTLRETVPADTEGVHQHTFFVEAHTTGAGVITTGLQNITDGKKLLSRSIKAEALK